MTSLWGNLWADEGIYLGAASLCAAAGAVFDVRSRRVPNLLTLPAMLVGVALHGALGGWRGSGVSVAGGAICFAVFLVFYLAGGMGAGDVKLIGALGCLAGLPHAAPLLIWTSLSGGGMALGLALYRGKLRATISNLGALLVHHRSAGLRPHPELNVTSAGTLRLPYALAMAAGSVVMLCRFAIER